MENEYHKCECCGKEFVCMNKRCVRCSKCNVYYLELVREASYYKRECEKLRNQVAMLKFKKRIKHEQKND